MLNLPLDAVRLDEWAQLFARPPGAARRPYSLTDEFLADVASTYREALRTGERPRRAVMAAFGIDNGNTAGKWIAKCREKGYLGPTDPGRQGEKEVE
jgi:hypothetical protein